MNELALNKQYFELKPTGLIINRKPTFDEWMQAGEVLKYIEGSVHWWLGDWLNFGEQTYGDMYSQALDKTDYEYGTLRNDKWVAGAFELSRRRDNLPFTYHQEVLSLDNIEAQNELLRRADIEGWKRDDLRQAVKEFKRKQLADASKHLSTPDDFILWHGDMQDECKKIPDNSIDLILTDPPYNVLVETTETWDEKEWDMETFAFQANRVLKDTGYFFCFGLLSFFHNLMQFTDKYFRVYFDFVWVKPAGINFHLSKMKPMNRHEQIACFINHCANPKSMTYNYRAIGDYRTPYVNKERPLCGRAIAKSITTSTLQNNQDGFRYPTTVIECYSRNKMPYAERTPHPTQKPLPLLEHIILGFTNENDIVLDPFIGSGSTAIACIKHNRNFIGIELDEAYCEIARKRIKHELTQLRLEV